MCGLRWDTLAQMLSFSGLHAGSRALVFDGVLGLVVGACAYRMRGHGTVLAAFDGQQPHFTVVDMLNLRAEDLNIIQTVPSEELAPAADNVRAQGFVQCTPEEVARQDAEAQALAAAATQAAAAVKAAHHPELVADGAVSQRVRNAKPHQGCGRQYEPVARVRRELRAGATCLVIASRHHPLSVLQECLALLVPSSPFVVYCEHVQPLVACYLHVTERRLAVKVNKTDHSTVTSTSRRTLPLTALSSVSVPCRSILPCHQVALSDTWMREFQTLPGRFHPEMFMSTTGGFLLTGIYVGMPWVADTHDADDGGNVDEGEEGEGGQEEGEGEDDEEGAPERPGKKQKR